MRAPLAIQRPESALFERYAGDDVAFGPRNLGLSGKALVVRVEESMEEAGLGFEAFRDRQTRSLSGGEKRRLALAGVLAMRGDALLLDEPTSALDPASAASILAIAFDTARKGHTVVFATHSMEEAAMADLVAVFSDGKVVASGDPETIFYDSFDPAWGLHRPFACAVAIELGARGFELDSRPLSVSALADAIQVAATATATATIVANVANVAKRVVVRGIEYFRNISIGQYRAGNSKIHRLTPATKYLWLLALMVSGIASSSYAGALLPLAVALAIGAAAGIRPGFLLRGVKPLIPLLVVTAILQSLFRGRGTSRGHPVSFGPLVFTAVKARLVLMMFARTLSLMTVIGLFTSVTSEGESVHGIEDYSRPLGRLGRAVARSAHGLALAVGIALRFVPIIVGELEAIAKAQASRGRRLRLGKGRADRQGPGLSSPIRAGDGQSPRAGRAPRRGHGGPRLYRRGPHQAGVVSRSRGAKASRVGGDRRLRRILRPRLYISKSTEKET